MIVVNRGELSSVKIEIKKPIRIGKTESNSIFCFGHQNPTELFNIHIYTHVYNVTHTRRERDENELTAHAS